jgi:hypothetical protein
MVHLQNERFFLDDLARAFCWQMVPHALCREIRSTGGPRQGKGPAPSLSRRSTLDLSRGQHAAPARSTMRKDTIRSTRFWPSRQITKLKPVDRVLSVCTRTHVRIRNGTTTLLVHRPHAAHIYCARVPAVVRTRGSINLDGHACRQKRLSFLGVQYNGQVTGWDQARTLAGHWVTTPQG